MRGIRIARFSELYLFIFQQIQLVMVLLGVGIVRQRKPGAVAGLCRHYAAFLVCADERARISLMRDLRVIASLCRVDMVFIAFPRFILWY